MNSSHLSNPFIQSMSAKSKKRPLIVTILSTIMIVLGILLIAIRIYILRLSLGAADVPNPEEQLVNMKLISGISLVGIGFIPLALGVGLWQLHAWSRAISICLFSSFFFPCLAAAIGLIPDPSMAQEREIIIVVVSAIALGILLHPAIAKAFAQNQNPREMEEI
jgi:ABC-type transport system involved in cytochrome c biogenesis permease subunit